MAKDKTQEIKKRLRELRSEKGLKQEEVAKLLHSDRTNISKWENPKYPLPDSISYYESLADVYGVSIDYILCRDDTRSVENELISQRTGLSDHSIEVLKYASQFKYSTFNDEEAENSLILTCINEVLEQTYLDMKDIEKRDIHSAIYCIFQELEHFFNMPDVVCRDGYTYYDEGKQREMHLIHFDSETCGHAIQGEYLYDAFMKMEFMNTLTRFRDKVRAHRKEVQ